MEADDLADSWPFDSKRGGALSLLMTFLGLRLLATVSVNPNPFMVFEDDGQSPCVL